MTTETTFAYSAGTRYSDNGLHERLSSAIECLRPLGPQFASVVAAIDQLLRRLAEGRFHLAVLGAVQTWQKHPAQRPAGGSDIACCQKRKTRRELLIVAST
jgi:thiamine biosynthesis lipoprotein ApbE